MKKILSPLFVSLLAFLATPLLLFSQHSTPPAYGGSWVHYIRTWTASAPETSPTNLIIRPLTDVQQITDYFDGFGRPMQTVQKKGSPAGNDLVSAHVYDGFGREVFKYLPFASNVAQAGDV